MRKFICNSNYQTSVQTLTIPKGGQKELLDLLVTDGNDGWCDKLYEFLSNHNFLPPLICSLKIVSYIDFQGNHNGIWL